MIFVSGFILFVAAILWAVVDKKSTNLATVPFLVGFLMMCLSLLIFLWRNLP